jgi:hypothetical protein
MLASINDFHKATILQATTVAVAQSVFNHFSVSLDRSND